MTPMEAVWGRKREDSCDEPEETPEGEEPSGGTLFVVACVLSWVGILFVSVLFLAWFKSLLKS